MHTLQKKARDSSEPGQISPVKRNPKRHFHLAADGLLRMQQTWGNQAVQRMLSALMVQTDPAADHPSDQAELEAVRLFDSPPDARSSPPDVSSSQNHGVAASSRVTKAQGVRPNVLQRKIVVGGQDLSTEKKVELKGYYALDPHGIELIDRMDNGGKSPDYAFTDFAQLKTEIEVRRNAIKGMEEIHKGCCRYPALNEDPYIDSQYWKRGALNYQFVPVSPFPAGKEASDAVEAIFKTNAGTRLDCWTIMVAVEYYALLKGLGAARFNQKFPAGAGMEISWRGTSNYPSAQYGQNVIFNQYDNITVASAAEILNGDWVYFKNFSDYLTLHPSGYWQGENAIYMGGGKYQGFGSGLKTRDEMDQKLADERNAGLPASAQKDIAALRAEGGGLLLTGVKRPKRM